MYYDQSRVTWVSTFRENVTFGLSNKSISHDRWMSLTGKVSSNLSGYRLPRNTLITAVTVQTSNIANCVFRIRKNGSPTNIHSVTLSGVDGITQDSLNVELNTNDWIQAYLDVTTGVVDYPEFLLELAWRE